MNSANMPMAFEPPPTQATTTLRQPAGSLQQLRLGLRRNDLMEFAHYRRNGCGRRGPQQVMRLVERAVQSRSASFTASFNVPEPESTGTTFAPMSCMRYTFGCCRATSFSPM